MATDPHIGTTIKRARERKRWTQRQLADALGVDRKTVDNWEHSRSYPRSSLGALEDVLGISLDGEPAAPAGMVPGDDWERRVLADETLPVKEREEIVRISRQARARLYPALEPRSAGGARETPAPGSRTG